MKDKLSFTTPETAVYTPIVDTVKDNNKLDLREVKDKSISLDKSSRIMRGIATWCSFYRANPHRFAKEYLRLNLRLFQQILLVLMNISNYFIYLASRGQGKTFLVAVFCVVRAILYPNTQICIASKNRSQGNEVLEKIINIILPNSPNLKLEIKEWTISASKGEIIFKNGSTIRVVTASDSSRGARANILIVDEFRLVPEVVISTILRRFLSAEREPEFMHKPEYEDKANTYKERNKELYLSSAWLKSHWSWKKVQAFCAAMVDDTKNYFVCGLPYQLPIKENLLNPAQVADEMSEADFNEMTWSIEMECLFWGENENAFFKYQDLLTARKIDKAIYPIDTITTIGNDKLASIPKKVQGEIRVVCSDIAVISSKKNKNDATAIIVMQLLPTHNGEYLRQILYLENYEGGHTETQALIIRRLFKQMECDYIVIDRAGAGIGVLDNLVKDLVDDKTGEVYEGLSCMNDTEIASRYKGKNPTPPKAIFTVVGSPRFNSECAFGLRDCIRRGKVNLLCPENLFEEKISGIKAYKELTPEQKMELKMPYIQTSLLISELIKLEYTTLGSEIRIKEQGTERKDRYSALTYGNYFATYLERNKTNKPKVENNKLIFDMRPPKIRSRR